MKPKIIRYIILLMSLSLVGIVIMQFIWIMNAVKINEEQFGRNVYTALNELVNRIETDETCKIISKNVYSINAKSKPDTIRIKYSESKNIEKKKKEAEINKIINEKLKEKEVKLENLNKTIQEKLEKKLEEKEIKLEELNKKLSEKFEKNEIKLKLQLDQLNKQMLTLDMSNLENFIKHKINKDTSSCDTSCESLCVNVINQDDSLMNNIRNKISIKTDKFRNVVEKMVVEYECKDIPLKTRLEDINFTTLLDQVLKNNAIQIPYEFIVKDNSQEKVSLVSDGYKEKSGEINFNKNLFPNDLLQKPDYISIYFPDRTGYVYKSLTLMIVGSILFTLIILLTFIVTIFAILRQKKNSEIKNDFINNMTHEFKTPIATISLASDAINNPTILENKEQVLNFNRIIKEETVRMNSQVEKVLQMSLFDKKDLEFHVSAFNIHSLIEQAIDRIKLQLEQKNGQIQVELKADEFYVEADSVHLSGALLNLLDNAIKYSNENPLIKITTFNKDGLVCITVADNGIGMDKDDTKRVFERFFRVHTGDVHNVKGFGLGLCYVKEVITAFKGKISVQSVKGSGSTFTICLPTIQHEQ